MITKYQYTPFGMMKNSFGDYMLYQSYKEIVDALIAEIVDLNEEIKKLKEEKKNAT